MTTVSALPASPATTKGGGRPATPGAGDEFAAMLAGLVPDLPATGLPTVVPTLPESAAPAGAVALGAGLPVALDPAQIDLTAAVAGAPLPVGPATGSPTGPESVPGGPVPAVPAVPAAAAAAGPARDTSPAPAAAPAATTAPTTAPATAPAVPTAAPVAVDAEAAGSTDAPAPGSPAAVPTTDGSAAAPVRVVAVTRSAANPTVGSASQPTPAPAAAPATSTAAAAAETGAVQPTSTETAGTETAGAETASSETASSENPVAESPAENAVAENASVEPAPVDVAEPEAVLPAAQPAAPVEPSRSQPSLPLDGVGAAAVTERAVATPAGPPAPPAPAAPVPAPATQVVSQLAPALEGPDGSYTMTLQLYPEELGAVQVEVSLRGGEISLALHAADEVSKELLRASLPDLRAQLEATGLTATDVSVDSGGPEQEADDRADSRRGEHRDGGGAGEPTESAAPLPTSDPDAALDVRM